MWGSSFLFYKLGLTGIPPLTLVTIRMGLGAMLLMLLLGGLRKKLRKIQTRIPICLCYGLIGCVLPFALFAFALQHVNSSLAGVLNSTMPLFTCLVAAIAKQERMTMRRTGGMLTGIVGVAVLLKPDSIAGNYSGMVLLGVVFCLLAALCYAVNTVAIRHTKGSGMEPATLALGTMIGATVISGLAATLFESPDIGSLGWQAAIGAIGLAFFGTAIAYLIFMSLIIRIGAVNASVSTLLIPVNAVPLGVLVLGEKISQNFMIGTVIILTSLLIIDPKLTKNLCALAQKIRRSAS